MKSIYTMRIFLLALVAYLLGAATVYFGNIFIVCLIFGVTVSLFFLYEAMSIEVGSKEREADEKVY